MKKQELTQLFYDLFVELSERYADVKKWVLLAEEMADKFPIASVNELRNALDHFFRTADQFDEEAIRTEFDGVRRHITRAGYDACNLVVYYLNQDIKRLIEKYNTEEITAVFPKYYKEIKKFLLDSNEALLVEARTYQRYRNNHDERRKVQEGETEELENKYQKFSKIVEKQHIYREEILGIIPALEEGCNPNLWNFLGGPFQIVV